MLEGRELNDPRVPVVVPGLAIVSEYVISTSFTFAPEVTSVPVLAFVLFGEPMEPSAP